MIEIEDIPLGVADPEVSARFYAALLGRRPLRAGPDYACFALDPRRTLSLWRKGADAPGDPGLEVGFPAATAAAVDDIHIDWWDRGAHIVLPPMDLAEGRGFVARDPDGHRLRVFAAAA